MLSVAVGGGWTNAGLSGAYYNNTTLSGPASFTRRDVRIDFDWGSTIKPGGSTAPGFSEIGTDNYSIQWAGRVIPRFAEAYTFKVLADDTFVLELKKSTDSAWTTVISQSAFIGSDSTGTFAMEAGTAYDVRITYKEFSGAALVKLRWQSASTPEEVIDPLTTNGYLVDGRSRFMFADMERQARTNWDGVAMDANGWPTGDGQLMLWEGTGDSLYAGTYACRFTGQAAVSIGGIGGIKLQVAGDGAFYDQLSLGQGWNSGTNTTTFMMIVPAGGESSPLALVFSGTRRLSSDTKATGITNLQVMRPRTVGGSDPYAFATIYSDSFKSAADVFTSFRWLDVNGNLGEKEWADRVRPNYGRSFVSGDVYNDGKQNKGWVYEYEIMFCNETGKDLYLTVPMRASNDYFTKLAQLLKYGSDANGNPYTSAVANPVYAPLNPNLHAYIEVSNEVWNTAGGFEQTRQADDDAVAAGTARSAEWNVINYDGTLNTSDVGGWSNVDMMRLTRWYALRTVRMSEQFRGIFGSDMMNRIRPVMYWQYNNTSMAGNEMRFVDGYFNNADGQSHVATPHPVSYYLWGAGGAAYYGSGNSQGRMSNDPMTNGGFDADALPLGQANVRPAASDWSFTGNAGIYGNGGSNYSSEGVSLAALPAPLSGNYAAYLTRGGTITRTINVSEAGSYAIGFGAMSPYEFPIDVIVNGQQVTPQYRLYEGAGEATAALGPAVIYPAWNRNLGSGWAANLTTAVFSVSAPGTVTVEISSPAADPGDPDYQNEITKHFLLLDNLYLGSVNEIFNGGMPSTGEALGQIGVNSWAEDRRQIAQYALAYGVEPASYESGWSLGGDTGSSPLQNYAKYFDPRAGIINHAAFDVFDQAGYGMVTYGVYDTWRDFDVANAANYELRKSFVEANDALGQLPTNGVPAGDTLTPGNQTVSMRHTWTWEFQHNTSGALNGQEWIDWNILVTTPGLYSFNASTTGGGTVQLIAGQTAIASGVSGSASSGSIYLTPGVQPFRIRAASGSFSVTSVTVSVGVVTAPAAPSGLSAVANSSSQITLTWNDNSGDETGFKIDYTTDVNFLAGVTTVPVGANNSATATTQFGSLNPNTTYYFRVRATNSAGDSVNFSAANATTPAAQYKLTGTIIGTAGSYKNSGNTKEKAMDGNIATYFDSSSNNGAWVGLDLNSAKQIGKVRFYPASGLASRMNGGKFQGSNDPNFGSGVVTLASINTTPPYAWSELAIANTASFRYVRYLSPNGSRCNVAEVEFYGAGAVANAAPNTPSNTSPANGASNQSPTLTLGSSAFSDPDAGDTHAASQWLIKRTSDGLLVFDSGTDSANKANYAVPSGKLAYSTGYSWQVRYQDNHGAWSSYSTATTFTTMAMPVDQPPVVNTFTATPGSVTVGDGISLVATASDPDAGDSITNVKFLEGNTLLGSGSLGNGQWTFTWNTSGHAAGSFTISAIAYDNTATASPAKTLGITINAPAGISKLTGTIIGTSGSYGNSGNTKEKAVDGDVSTYFDSSIGSGAWVGLDLGTAQAITKVRFYPRAGQAGRMIGGIFQGSNDPSFATGVVNLATIATLPPYAWSEIAVTDTTAFRYVRYLSPANSWGNVAEVEFYGSAG